MKRIVSLLLALAMLLGVAAAAETADAPKEIVISLGTTTCDGNNDPTQRTNRAYSFFYSTLYTYDDAMELIPDLATGYEVSDDLQTYTFTLRDDVKFSDGSALTSKDVAFTYEKAKESGAAIDLTGMDSIETPDDTTVVFKLSAPNSLFLNNTAFLGIVCADKWSEAYSLDPIGSGPYKMVQLDQDQQMILEKNEYYYGQEPDIDKITILELSDDVVLAAIQAGTVDLAGVPATQAGQEIEGYSILACTTNVTKFAHFFMIPAGVNDEGTPIGNDVTIDPAIRQALNIGINRQEIADFVMNGYGEPAYTLINNMAWSNDEPAFEDCRVDEAIAILEEAGWVDTDGDGIREKDGVKASIPMNGSADETERYNIAVALSQQAEALGIEIVVTSKAWADCRAEAGSVSTVWSVGNYSPMDLSNYFRSDLGGVSWYNPAFYSNEKVDEYIKAAVNGNPAEANDNWQKTQYDGETGANIDLPYLPIILAQDVYYVRDGLDVSQQRVHDHGMGGMSIIYNWANWTLNK